MDGRIYFPNNYIQDADLFVRSYDMQKAAIVPDAKMKKNHPIQNQTCRFCKRKKPEVTFQDDAHIISSFLGNRYWVSDFECDDCNNRFGLTYEDHFANFLGINRTLSNVKGKVKVPTFKSSDKKLRVEKQSFFGIDDCIVVSNMDADDPAAAFDMASGNGQITSAKLPYRPIWAYKALLKYALGSLDETDVKEYEIGRRFLMTDAHDKQFSSLCVVRGYRMPVGCGIKEPYVVVFKRKKHITGVPKHIFGLFIQNVVYEIFIPLSRADDALYQGKYFSVNWCPPFFKNPEDAENIPVAYNNFDLSSSEIVYGDTETIHFAIDRTANQNFTQWSPGTGINTSIDTNSGTKKIILVPPGSTIDISKFEKKQAD